MATTEVRFNATRYSDSQNQGIRRDCYLVLNSTDKTFRIENRRKTTHSLSFQGTDIRNIICGRSSGFLLIWLKEHVLGLEQSQLLLDITPNYSASRAAKIIRSWSSPQWDIVATVFSARYVIEMPLVLHELILLVRSDKELLIDHFAAALTNSPPEETTVTTEVAKEVAIN